jgi:signal transduction histidine kinase
MVEVPDVFADPTLADWQDVARELGFRALVALPLAADGARGGAPRLFGTITFYFADESRLADDQRSLLRVVADQLAAAAEKAELIDELRRANAALVESNAELERQYVAVLEARRVKDEFLANMSHELRTPLAAVQGYVALMLDELSGPLTDAQRADLSRVRNAGGRLLDLIDNLLELTTLKRGGLEVHVDDCDPRSPLVDAVAQTAGRPPSVALRVDEPTSQLPALRSDRKKIAKILVSLLANAYKFTPSGEVLASVEVRDGRVAYRVQTPGSASRRTRSRWSSTSSARWTARRCGSTAAPGWAWHSRAGSRGCWAATSSWCRRSERARRSPWSCRWSSTRRRTRAPRSRRRSGASPSFGAAAERRRAAGRPDRVAHRSPRLAARRHPG